MFESVPRVKFAEGREGGGVYTAASWESGSVYYLEGESGRLAGMGGEGGVGLRHDLI